MKKLALLLLMAVARTVAESVPMAVCIFANNADVEEKSPLLKETVVPVWETLLVVTED